jgi:hypothetical protein
LNTGIRVYLEEKTGTSPQRERNEIMGYFYNLDVYLGRLNEPYYPVYIGWLIAMICFYWYYYKSLRQGFKDKCGGMP